MLTKAMKFLGLVSITSVLASAVVLTAIHQLVWRYQPLNEPTEFVYKVYGMMGSCSGVMIAPQRMLTAAHCANLMDLTVNGKPAKTLKIEPSKDLLLLEVALDCPCVPVADTEGTNVTAVGYPLGLVKATAVGILRGYTFDPILPEFYEFAVYQSSVEGGFSGGGVFTFRDGRWELVGIVSAGSKTLMLAPTLKMVKEFLK